MLGLDIFTAAFGESGAQRLIAQEMRET